MSVLRKIVSVVLCAIMVLSIVTIGNIETEAATYASISLNIPWYSMRHKNGCGISSLAMVEGYVKGYGDNDWACYSAVYNKNKEIYPDNPVVLYSYSAIGYTTISNSLASVYEQLQKGNPVVVYRTNADRTLNHFSVIYGYSGSTTNLEKKGFKVKNTIYDSSYSAISWIDAKSKGADTNLETWLKGANWTQTLIRTSNKITSLPNKKNTVQVSFNANGGTSSASSGTYVVGEIYGNSLPSATRVGYTFDGWYTSADGGTLVVNSSTVTSGNKTLYAHWTKNQSDILEVGHVYRIYNENSGLVLASNGTSNGSWVCQRNKGEKGNGELWRVTEISSDGYYKFESLDGCKALDVDADDRYLLGAKLQVYDKNSHDAQKFSIIKRGNKAGYSGVYSIHSKNSGRAIDVSGASTKSGTALQQWVYHGGKAQLFYFEEVETRNITFYDNFNNNYIASPAEEYEHINSATPTKHYASRNTDYVKVTLKPDTDSLYIQALKAGSSEKDMNWITLINGSHTRNFAVKNNSTMVLNFRAKSSVSGAKIYFRWGYDSTSTYQSVTLTNSWAEYSVELKRTADSGSSLHPYIDKACNVEVSDISLYEKGTTGYIGDTDAYTAQTIAANVNDDYIQPAPLPKNNRSGYTFNGWFTKRVGGTRVAGAAEYFSAPLDGNQCLYAHWTKSAETTYTLTYNANGGSGAPSSQSGAASYVISSTQPTRNGYTFLGWSTSSNATSATYFAGESITLAKNTTLYAVWEEIPVYNAYELVYDANGGTGAPLSQTSETNAVIYVSTDKPSRFGYLFMGWNTLTDGSGYWYYPGDQVTLVENITLYAMWQTLDFTLGSNTILEFGDEFDEYYIRIVPTESKVYVVESKSTEYNLDMVGAIYDVNGTEIASNDDISSEDRNFKMSCYLDAGKTYYIYLRPFYATTGTAYLFTSEAYSVYFDANSGNGAPDTLTGDYKYIIPDEIPYRDGYKFLGWTTDPNYNYIDKAPGDEIEIIGDCCLYAVWENNSAIFTVYYDANGGINAPQTQTVNSDEVGYVPSAEPERAGYTFIGWCTESDGTGEWYYSGSMLRTQVDMDDMVLYAIWSKEDPSISVFTMSIRTPSVTTISYGDSIILHADITGTLPEGATIQWFADNGNFEKVASNDGKTCKITPSSSGNTTFTIKVVNADGEVLAEDTQVMTSKAGFFDKIIGFFKMIFGLTKTFAQAIKRGY